MIMSFWNCRGAGSRSFPRMLRDITKKYGIQVMGLLETRISGTKANKVATASGFSNWLRVEATGFAGGIWLFWNDQEIRVEYITSTPQLLHCSFYDRKEDKHMLITLVYGETTAQKRTCLWESLLTLSRQASGPWVVMGDFNCFLDHSDKVGGAPLNSQKFRSF